MAAVLMLIFLLSLAGIDPKSIDCAILATVVPETLFNLRLLVRRYFGCEPLVVGEPNLVLPVNAVIEHPEVGGAFPYEGYPVRMSRTRPQIHNRAPALAEHNGYVYGELLGMSEHEIAGLRERGVI